jgi:hypothetical protein
MKKWLKSLGLVCLVFLAGCSNSYNYTIQEYKLTLEPRNGSTDVKATIEITYLMDGAEAKADGFKFVGESKVDSLVCSDENGIISSNIDYLKETKLTWQFNPVSSGTKKVKVAFILRNLILKENGLNSINISWPGVFRVPVSNATYYVLFDKKPKSIQFEKPDSWKSSYENGKVFYFYSQPVLKEKTIVFNYNF